MKQKELWQEKNVSLHRKIIIASTFDTKKVKSKFIGKLLRVLKKYLKG
jgi:hypothetical protein